MLWFLGWPQWSYVFCHLSSALCEGLSPSAFWSPPMSSQVSLLLSPWPPVCCGYGWCVAARGLHQGGCQRLAGPCTPGELPLVRPFPALSVHPQGLHPPGLFHLPHRTFF